MPRRAKAAMAGTTTPPDSVLIRLHPLELARGVLIPGHRFEALRDEETLPWQLRLSDGAGKPLSLRPIAMSYADLRAFNTLFGLDSLPQLLILDDPENMKALESAELGSSDFLVRVRAFDLSALYGKEGLEAGDYLHVRMVDAWGKRFSLEGVKAASIDPGRRKRWFEGMEKGFQAAMKKLMRPGDNSALIREAYRLAPTEIRKEPAAALSEFVDEAGTVELTEFAGRWLLWGKGYDPLDASLPYPPPPPGSSDLDKILHELGLSLDSEEFEAFVRDELFAGRPAKGAVSRCFNDLDGLGYPPADLATLNRLAVEAATAVESRYDPGEDREAGPVRRLILPPYERFMAWMRDSARAGLSPRDLPRKEFGELTGLMASFLDLARALNSPESFGKDQLSQLVQDTPEFSVAVDALLATLPALDLPAPSRVRGKKAPSAPGSRGKKRKPKARPPALRTYTLACRLMEIEPPVTRLIAVPGNRSLGGLHDILQAAFGWQDCHLHAFTVRGERYAVPSSEDFEPVRDEATVRLDDLGLRARSRIEYEYDFGDSWIHELVVMSASKALPDADVPVLLGGERAAPPEDCGGPPGYEDLVAALAKKPSRRNEDEKDLVAWAGDWRPGDFDIKRAKVLVGGLR